MKCLRQKLLKMHLKYVNEPKKSYFILNMTEMHSSSLIKPPKL